MKESRMDGFRALSFLIKQPARTDKNPKVGQLYPKEYSMGGKRG